MINNLLANIRKILLFLGVLQIIKRYLYKLKLSKSININGVKYKIKVVIEKAIFSNVENIHDLPAIHDYWMKNHIIPRLSEFGYHSIEDFFIINLENSLNCTFNNSKMNICSIGSGNCDFEIGLIKELVSRGHVNFNITCIDFNQKMLDRGIHNAKIANIENFLSVINSDFNIWLPEKNYDCYIANMSLHHVLNLEGLFENIRSKMNENSYILVFDIIGRNGHMRWPEALKIVNEYWAKLPIKYKYNNMVNRFQDEYINYDCSNAGFEGIRSQDILPLLNQKFYFTDFFAFANIIEPFIDRSIGKNFDPDVQFDRNQIDEIHARDTMEMEAGNITPTHMLAKLSNTKVMHINSFQKLTPDHCIRIED